MKKKKLTTASGRPYSEFENSMTVGSRGRVLSPPRESKSTQNWEDETEETEDSISTGNFDNLAREERSEGETEGVGEEMKSRCR